MIYIMEAVNYNGKRRFILAKPEFNAVVIQRSDLSEELFTLRVAPINEKLSPFQPGQFAVLGLPGPAPDKFIQRAYSIASSPLIKDYFEFYITLVKNGELTPLLVRLKPGDRLFLSPKISGNFTMEGTPESANVVLIATGTGVAPFMSMLQTCLRPGQRRLALFHGVRESIDLGYRSEMTTMEAICKNFSYHPILSRPQSEKIPWKGMTGHVQALWEAKVLEKKWGFKPTPENTHIFLCGSPAMIESMIELMEKEGFQEHKKTSPGQIHVERYW